MSIEEAWKNVMGLDQELTHGTTHEGCVAAAARALALAVIAEDCLKEGFIGYYNLRKRIEGLK